MVRVLQYSDLENAYDDPTRIGRLAGLIGSLRDERTLVVGTGDNTAPGVVSLATEGRAALAFFNAVDPDAETFGNHDFDYGSGVTRELVRDSPQRWLSANVSSDGMPFSTEVGVVPHATFVVGDAYIGCVGVTDPATTDSSPGADGLTIADPVEAVGRALAELRPRADYVVVLSHCGALDDELASQFDIDAVLGGHVHDERAERVAGTVCTRPNAGGHHLCAVDLETGDATLHDVAAGPVDDEVKNRFERIRARVGLEAVVATIERPIYRRWDHRLGGECRVGNFVTDAYRWAADADCALHNAGGLRDGPPLDGRVSVGDLVSLAPFDEPVVIAALTGRELRATLGEADRAPHGRAGWHAHVSGVRLVYDTATRTVRDCRVDGTPLDPDRTYRLATNAYLLDTRTEFPTLAADHRVATLDVQWRVLAAYARERGIDPRVEGRVVFRG